MKVSIIGAGISGMCVGTYLQMCGFETEIFERHTLSGGLCTSWKRGGYTFDGCLQWLMGSNSSNAFYKLWSELLDMESIHFVHHESRLHLEVKNTADKYGSKVFILYSNLDRFENYLLDIAPEDSKYIRSLVGFVRKIQMFELPPLIDKGPEQLTLREMLGMRKYIALGRLLLKWRRVTNVAFANKLKNPFLKEAFMLLFDGDAQPLLIHTVPMASYDTQGAGYPLGGSYRFAQKFEEKYLASGGKIYFNSGISKILTDKNKASGLLLDDGRKIFSDIVVSAADWHYTVFEALGGQYTDSTIMALKEEKSMKVYFSVFMVAMGLSRTFEDYPHIFRFPLKEKLTSPDGTDYARLEVHIYNYDPTLAPPGKTVVSVSYYTQGGDYWINLRKTKKEAYNKEKNRFATQIVDALEEKFGDIRHYIEEMDITTPATYQRYTGNFRGSVQGWLPGKKLSMRTPVKTCLPGLKNFFFCGHWTRPGGGLPIAIKSARDVAVMICKKNKVPYNVKKQQVKREV